MLQGSALFLFVSSDIGRIIIHLDSLLKYKLKKYPCPFSPLEVNSPLTSKCIVERVSKYLFGLWKLWSKTWTERKLSFEVLENYILLGYVILLKYVKICSVLPLKDDLQVPSTLMVSGQLVFVPRVVMKILCMKSLKLRYQCIVVKSHAIFNESALWADSVSKLQCPLVMCLCVCFGATISIGQESQCLPYAGFKKKVFLPPCTCQ